jgi:serine/threonine-protein kinase
MPDPVTDDVSDITVFPLDEPPAAPVVTGRYIGQLLGDKYRLVRLLGRGAMGEVYKARVEGSEQVFAVKVMLPHVAAVSQNIARFRREARATAQIVHPNVIRVFDLSEDSSRQTFFIVMEFLSGRSVEQWLTSLEVPPPLADVKTVMLGILAALEVAHEHGVVHRDLKPANVFLAEEGGQIVIKILDFGLARIVTERGGTLTKVDMVAGTPDYMSPEQCQSLRVGPSTDIYALGCILTELLQLDSVFGGNDQMETMARQMLFLPPPIRRPAFAEPVPAALEGLRLALLAKKPEQRPQSIAGIRERFLASFEGQTCLVSASLAPLPPAPASSAHLMAARPQPPTAPAAPPASVARLDVSLPPRAGASLVSSPPTRPRSGARRRDASLRPGAGGSVDIALLSLSGSSPDGVNSACITGLGDLGFFTRSLPDLSAVVEAGLPVLVLDAGSDLAGAIAFLEAARGAQLESHTVVCTAMLPAEEMNRLASAGAAEIVFYPVAPDILAVRVARALRHRLL